MIINYTDANTRASSHSFDDIASQNRMEHTEKVKISLFFSQILLEDWFGYIIFKNPNIDELEGGRFYSKIMTPLA